MEFNLAQVHDMVTAAASDRECIVWRDRRLSYAEVADRTRRERAQLGLSERLTAVLDGPTLELRVAGLGTVRGVVTGTGPGWVLVDQRTDQPLSVVRDERPERPVLVAVPAIRSVLGLAGAEPSGLVARGLGLGAALRAVSRDRAVVDVVDLDGAVVTGTLDAVGQDLVEVAEHPGDLPRRAENVLRVVALPFAALAAVRRRR